LFSAIAQQVAIQNGTGFIFESATWRASQDWADKLDISEEVTKLVISGMVELSSSLNLAFDQYLQITIKFV
jgi:hypothetical protein